MVHYKLTYFAARGFAEPSRQILHLAEVDFEDVRLPLGDPTWPKLKNEVPFGQLPVLSIDGFEIPQSTAILRYLGRKFGYAGKTPEEEAWVDAIVDQFKDFIGIFRQYISAVLSNKPIEEQEKIRKEISQPACNAGFKTLTRLLENSTSGYLVGDSLTFADLVVADYTVILESNKFFNKGENLKIAEHREKIHNFPKLKDWIATRPHTQF